MVSKRYQSAPLTKTSGLGNPGSTITIHETANTSNGANAAAHANLQSKGNVRDASWHWSVDDREAVQSFQNNVKCWHAGTSAGNNTSIGIEICVNADGNFSQAVENAAQLVADILKERHLTPSAVVQHNRWSGKNCPTNLRNGSKGPTWASFIARVTELYHGTVTPVPNPIPTPTPPAPSGLVIDGMWGRATTKRAQQVLGTIVDGEVWYQYAPNRQPAWVDGWVYNYTKGHGSELVKAFQRALGVSADGVWGKQTTIALQNRYGLVADGELWANSPAVKELQRRLNAGTI